jgi:hypothetical protein
MTTVPATPNTVVIPLAIPLPTLLERLRAATAPPHWTDRLVRPYLVCTIDPHHLSLRRSHTYRSLGLIEFRAPLDTHTRELAGTFHLTRAAKAFWTLWSLLWLTVLVLTLLDFPQAPANPEAPSPGTAIGFCLLCLGLVPLLCRVPKSNHHPERRWLMEVLQRSAGTSTI